MSQVIDTSANFSRVGDVAGAELESRGRKVQVSWDGENLIFEAFGSRRAMLVSINDSDADCPGGTVEFEWR